jgi:hypothetical protein
MAGGGQSAGLGVVEQSSERVVATTPFDTPGVGTASGILTGAILQSISLKDLKASSAARSLASYCEEQSDGPGKMSRDPSTTTVLVQVSGPAVVQRSASEPSDRCEWFNVSYLADLDRVTSLRNGNNMGL